MWNGHKTIRCQECGDRHVIAVTVSQNPPYEFVYTCPKTSRPRRICDPDPWNEGYPERAVEATTPLSADELAQTIPPEISP